MGQQLIMRNKILILLAVFLLIAGTFDWRPQTVSAAISNHASIQKKPHQPDQLPGRTTSGAITHLWEPVALPINEDALLGKLAVHPQNASAVVWGSWSFGLYRSFDAGLHWTRLLTDTIDNVIDLAVSTGDPPRLYLHAFGQSSGNRYYRSDDWGDSWTQITNPPVVSGTDCGMYPAASKPDYIYVLECWWDNTQYLFRSQDDGQTWSTIPLSFPDAISQIAVSPDNPELLITATGTRVYTSHDGGDNWSELPIPAPGVYDFYFAPEPPHSLYLTHQAGILCSKDAGQTWQYADVGFYPYYLIASPLAPDTLLIGDKVNSYQFKLSGNNWISTFWAAPEGTREMYRSVTDNQVIYAQTETGLWRYKAHNLAYQVLLPLISQAWQGSAVADAQRALDQVNSYRTQASVNPLVLHASIVTAAQNHANYAVINASDPSAFANGPHGEVHGKAGFTGTWPYDRMVAAGFTWSGGGEIIHYIADPVASVDSWMTTIYHRVIPLDPRTNMVGYGLGSSEAMKVDVMDFGRGPATSGIWSDKLPPYALGYPANGQALVPTSWDGGESPDPLPPGAARPVGFPFTLQGAYGTLEVTFAEMRNAGGKLIQVHPNPPDCKAFNCYALIPVEPLLPSTTYIVRAQGKVAGFAFDQVWSFTTAP